MLQNFGIEVFVLLFEDSDGVELVLHNFRLDHLLEEGVVNLEGLLPIVRRREGLSKQRTTQSVEFEWHTLHIVGLLHCTLLVLVLLQLAICLLKQSTDRFIDRLQFLPDLTFIEPACQQSLNQPHTLSLT